MSNNSISSDDSAAFARLEICGSRQQPATAHSESAEDALRIAVSQNSPAISRWALVAHGQHPDADAFRLIF